MPAGEQYQGASDFQIENGTLHTCTKGVGMGAFKNALKSLHGAKSLNASKRCISRFWQIPFTNGDLQHPKRKVSKFSIQHWTTKIIYRVRDAECTSPTVKCVMGDKEDNERTRFSLNVFPL
jgi:hypothetical protein